MPLKFQNITDAVKAIQVTRRLMPITHGKIDRHPDLLIVNAPRRDGFHVAKFRVDDNGQKNFCGYF